MDSLCLKTTTISAAIPIDVRTTTNSSQVRSTTTPFSRFSFNYPLKSLWPGAGGGRGRGRGPTYSGSGNGNGNGNGTGMALHDAVPLELEEPRESGNWVLKILHVRSLWGGGGGGDEQAEQPPPGDQPAAINDTRTCDCHDGCRIEQDDPHFDKDSFSRFLRKVSLAEARLYAQMSYLGTLAYSIPKIQVRTNQFISFVII